MLKYFLWKYINAPYTCLIIILNHCKAINNSFWEKKYISLIGTSKFTFWHFGRKYNFVDFFFRNGFSIIWAMFMLKQLILSIKLFFQIPKNFFFYDPHHSDKKWRPIAEFLTDFEKIFTFVIRITFLTNREVPRRIRERDLVQYTPRFIILALLVILQYKSSFHFEKKG